MDVDLMDDDDDDETKEDITLNKLEYTCLANKFLNA